MAHFTGVIFGFLLWFAVRYILFGIVIVNQNERAVKTSFGRAVRIPGKTTLDDPVSQSLNNEERERYTYPQLRVYLPGWHFKMPWEDIYKVSISTETVSMALDPEVPTANAGGQILEAVTKDQLNIGLTGQIRYRVAERNLYAYFFGVKSPYVHVMGYFVSLLRERLASFEAPHPEGEASAVGAVSINDLRKNLRDINELMEQECISSAARYGIVLEASLITGIDPPKEVESALAAINTAHNHVSSDISLAQASADQRIVQSKKAVEIETMKADAEVKPLVALAEQLATLKQSGSSVLNAYVQNFNLGLLTKAQEVIKENNA